jgi:arabinofuranosyltransferase
MFIKFAITSFFVIINVIISWLFNYRSIYGTDDANIYMVYMRNFAEGYGFVYNLGYERVEGFTSLLWTIIGAIFFKISETPEVLMLLFNIFLISYALWLLVVYIDRDYKKEGLISNDSLLLLGLLSVVPGFFDWTVLSLMETGLWSALLIILGLETYKFIDKPFNRELDFKFCVLLIILTLTRPEGIIWGVAFICLRVYVCFVSNKNFYEIYQIFKYPIFIFLSTILLITIWRYNYFGYLLPNTFYAKVSIDPLHNFILGIKYTYRFLKSYPFIILYGIACIKILIEPSYNDNSKKRLFNVINFIFLIITLIYPLAVGGDHMSGHRFIQPTIPLMLFGAIYLMNMFYKLENIYYVTLIIFISGFISREGYIERITRKDNISSEWKIAIDGRLSGEKLNLFFSNHSYLPSVGHINAGGMALTYKGLNIDLMGLNNTLMAHSTYVKDRNLGKNHASFDKEVFFMQRPEIFRWYIIEKYEFDPSKIPCDNYKFDWVMDVLKNIPEDERFFSNYDYVAIENIKTQQILIGYATRDFIESLDLKYFIPYKCNLSHHSILQH